MVDCNHKTETQWSVIYALQSVSIHHPSAKKSYRGIADKGALLGLEIGTELNSWVEHLVDGIL